jgi:rhamnosyltransferase
MERQNNENKPPIDVSIIIPAKDEEANIGKCLEAIFHQDTTYRFEVVVIDSGSRDQTIDIIRQFPSVHLQEIPPESFGHGKTRNLGAKLSQGKYLVFLNADALPVDEHWLDPLIAPLRTDNEIAGVYSRHLPKKECHLYMVRDLHKSMPAKPKLRTKMRQLDFMIFSTVSCAISRDTWERYPFADEIEIAEDQQWAQRVLAQGLKIKYEPASQVYHSHNYTGKQLKEIKFKVGKAQKRFKNIFTARVWGFLLMIGGMKVKIIEDIVFILFKSNYPGHYSWSMKLVQIRISVKARRASFIGRYRGWLEGYDE